MTPHSVVAGMAAPALALARSCSIQPALQLPCIGRHFAESGVFRHDARRADTPYSHKDASNRLQTKRNICWIISIDPLSEAGFSATDAISLPVCI